MKKNILLLTNNDQGIYLFRKELIRILISSNYKVFISTPIGIKKDSLEKMGVTLLHTNINRHSMNPISDFKLLIHYFKLIKKINPEMILTYTIKPNVYGGFAARLKKFKYIVTITGLGQSLKKRPKSFIPEMLYRMALKSAHHVFFQNQENMQYMLDKRLLNNHYSLINGSGVNLEEYSLIVYPDNDTVIYLFAGRIMKDKGIEEFLGAAKYVKSIYPKSQFLVVGSMEENYTSVLEEYQSKGIINYIGYVEDLTPLYKRSHVIVLPSYHEGLSNVLLEASAIGRPSIASNIPGCQEVIMDNESGYLVVPKDEMDLTSKLISFYNLDYNEKLNMGLKAREIVENKFDRTKIVETYIERINHV